MSIVVTGLPVFQENGCSFRLDIQVENQDFHVQIDGDVVKFRLASEQGWHRQNEIFNASSALAEMQNMVNAANERAHQSGRTLNKFLSLLRENRDATQGS